MKESRRTWSAVALCVVVGVGLSSSCARRQTAEVNDIVPSFEVSRSRAPLGSYVEARYTWTLEPTARKLEQDYRALVHFVDSHKVVLFTDDHVPSPPVTEWEPGKSYTYERTVFVPIYPYVGDVRVVMGLYPASGRGERVLLKGEDMGLRAFKVAEMEFLPQTENIFLVYKEGWHSPESSPQNPSLERTWTKREALVSFKNPGKDVILYLEADTNAKAFSEPPVLTVGTNAGRGLAIPIENSEVFVRKIRFTAEDLGDGEWVDLKLAMNGSFVPRDAGVNDHDDRELGLLVYHLWLGEEGQLGELAADAIVATEDVAFPETAESAPAPDPAS